MRYVTLLVTLVGLLGGMRSASAAEPLPHPQGAVILAVTGNVTQTNAPGQAQFDKAMLEALGKASYTTSSEVSATPMTFEGVPLRAVLERVGALGKTIKATALNAYQISIPMEDLQFEPILAMKVDGRVITARDKGPLWIAYPRDAHPVLQDAKYDSRWVWQLSRLHIE
ncbi:molybdopterin-dependent oxidoreductase [Microvirga sp. G4-2]|uniref:molybdopterin-dependent oxidoreductase n=1 Tax=Microvirga sp. G4-2 TaxID=3434467 RepID=UPI0040450DC3